HSHGIPARRLQRLVEAYLFSQPNFVRLICISNALRQEYLRVYPKLSPERVLVAPNGADLTGQEAKALDIWPGRDESLQVGYVGHLYSGRGVEVVIQMAEQTPDIDYHLIGGTDPDNAYWRSATPLSNVHFHGFLPQTTLPS